MRRKHLLSILITGILTFIVALLPLNTKAAEAFVIDEVNTFTNEELAQLNTLAEEISNRQQCGVYVVITDDMHGYSERTYAEGLFYNYDMGYGGGEGASGVVLAISFGDSYYDTFSYGAAGDTFTTSVLDTLNNLVYDYLADGDWYGACEAYIKRCDELLTQTGYHYYVPEYTDPTISQHIVTSSAAQRRSKWLSQLPFAGIISAAIGGISVFSMKGRNKNTGIKKSADQYIIQNGVRITHSNDIFINRTRAVTHIQRNTGTGGGGGGGGHSYHSSGGVHSSGGRHF